MIVLVYIC